MTLFPSNSVDIDGRRVRADEALRCEWLEADGLGGFASGTALGVRTRRYHAILSIAVEPPADRWVLAQDVEVFADSDAGTFALSSSVYPGDVVHPDGVARLVAFRSWPWPCWTWSLPGGDRIDAELVVPRGRPIAVLRWTRAAGTGALRLRVRPRLGPRDPHGAHRSNDTIDRGVSVQAGVIAWDLYAGVPTFAAFANGTYTHAPIWFRDCVYLEERARGLDDREDLFSPGELAFALDEEPATLVFGAAAAVESLAKDRTAAAVADALVSDELARRSELGPRGVAREAYIARRGNAPVIIAGYPWFGEWGRDSFIAVRGLCLAADRFEEALAMLESWTGVVSEGMLPNRFPDRGNVPEYNSVDASLWYALVVHELVAASERSGRPLPRGRVNRLWSAVDAVIDGYLRGTRHGIRVDTDGLVAAGERGVQLTWMDARVDGDVITPRVGKPVEVQALWLNVLAMAQQRRPELAPHHARAAQSFADRFVLDDVPWLADVVDVDHVAGTVDRRLRPNQIYALGGLPLAVVEGARARAALDAVEHALWTPIGLRTLAPGDPAYVGRYGGGVRERDGAYHQGTVWPHLLGPFVDAWLRVQGADAVARARQRFLAPLREHLCTAGLWHVSEIADADPPHTPRGAPFQAWGLAELIRLELRLGEEGTR